MRGIVRSSLETDTRYFLRRVRVRAAPAFIKSSIHGSLFYHYAGLLDIC